MPRYKHRGTVPPGGWFYIQKETRLRILGESLTDLSRKVLEHRVYKSLERATLGYAQEDIERQTCLRLDRNQCYAEGADDTWVPVAASPVPKLSAVMAFSKTAFEFIKSGAELVDTAEAKRRTDICLGCPLNTRVTGCKCSIFYKTINQVIPEDRKNPELGVCGICSCSLQAKVNLTADVIRRGETRHDLQYPPHCWLPEILTSSL
jgi:hypothetical protein